VARGYLGAGGSEIVRPGGEEVGSIARYHGGGSINGGGIGSINSVTSIPEMDLEENIRRKALTPAELSKELVRRTEKIAPVISTAAVEKGRRGRKAAHGSPKAEIAAALGTGTTTLERAEQHVEAATKYPDT
jgi:hypothetical protein